MATIEQVQRGVVRFVDNQVSTAFDGWQKVVVSGFAGLMAANLPKLMSLFFISKLLFVGYTGDGADTVFV